MKRAQVLYFIFLFTVFFSMSCATIQEKNESSLRNVAERYWEMRMGDNYRESYKMEDSEGLPPFDTYSITAAAIKRLKITSHTIKGVSIDGEKGIVHVDFIYTLPEIPKPVHQTLGDRWLYRDGRWWHLLNRQ